MSIKDLAAKFDDLKKQMVKELQEEFKNVLDKHPEITVIKWAQYTPYFNDGDECNFSVHDFTISNAPNVDDVTYYDYKGDDSSVFVFCGRYEDKEKKYADIWDFEKIDNEIFKDAFGDHVEVIVTRDGIDIQEYNHD